MASDADFDLFRDTATAVATQARWHGVLRNELVRPMSAASGQAVREFMDDGSLDRGVEALARVRGSLGEEDR